MVWQDSGAQYLVQHSRIPLYHPLSLSLDAKGLSRFYNYVLQPYQGSRAGKAYCSSGQRARERAFDQLSGVVQTEKRVTTFKKSHVKISQISSDIVPKWSQKANPW